MPDLSVHCWDCSLPATFEKELGNGLWHCECLEGHVFHFFALGNTTILSEERYSDCDCVRE